MPDIDILSIPEFQAKLDLTNPVESDQRQTRYLSEFAGGNGYAKLGAAKTAIGTSTLTTLRIDVPITVTVNADFTPSNIELVFDGNGKITMNNTSHYFIVGWMRDPGDRQVFVGDVRIAAGGTDGYIKLRWWVPRPTAATPIPTITTQAISGARYSIYWSGGGTCYLPQGTYNAAGSWGTAGMYGTQMIGPGSQANGIGGSGCVIRPVGDNATWIDLPVASSQQHFEGFTVDLDKNGYTGQTGFYAHGAFGDGNVSDIYVTKCRFDGGRAAFRCHSTDATTNAGMEIAPIFFYGNTCIGQKTGCIETNTVNNMVVSLMNTYAPTYGAGIKSSVFRCQGTGGVFSRFDMFRGLNAAFPQTYNIDFVQTDVTTGSGTKVTKTIPTNAASEPILWTGRPVYTSNVSGTSPTGMSTTKWRYVRVSGSDISFHPTAYDAFSNTNREQWSAAGTGTTRIWTNEYKEDIWPWTVFWFDGVCGPSVASDFQCEGFPRFAYFPSTASIAAEGNTRFTMRNGTPQGAIDIRGGNPIIHLDNVMIPPRHIMDRPGVEAKVILNNVSPQRYIDGVTYYAPGSCPLAVDRDIMNVVGPQLASKGTRVVAATGFRPVRVVNGASYTVDAWDNGCTIWTKSSSQTTITIPPDLDAGFSFRVIQKGTGQALVAGGAGVTVGNVGGGNATTDQNAVMEVTGGDLNEYLLSGDVELIPINWAATATVTDTRHNGAASAASWMTNGQRHTNNAWNPGGAGGGGWDSGGGGIATAQLDFGTNRAFTHVRMYTLADALNYNTDPTLSDTFTSYGQAGYDLEWSTNGSSWTSIASETTNNHVRVDYNGTWTARYVRITSKLNGTPDNPGGGNARIIELEVWSSDPG